MDEVDAQNLAAKQRFDSYKLGSSEPKLSGPSRTSAHGRSHSRNTSMSISISAPSLSTISLNSPVTSKSMQDLASAAGPSKRPNSHHRRRSSVSTRRESSEIITGVVLPEGPGPDEEDKDAVRRRALWALEGKPEVSFAKVQLPELSTPVLEKMLYDFSNKPSFPTNSFRNVQKRDSFKLLSSSSSSKDQLHTLVEEEEESNEPSSPVNSPTEKLGSGARGRPATLSLRPLALTPNNLVTNPNGLPTPTLTPRYSGVTPYTKVAKRQSLSLLSCNTDSSPPFDKRSSISYKRTQGTLPTPDATPTSSVRCSPTSSSSGSISSTGEESFANHRPLSASEQHFLFKSHNALLARITDLEHALTSRPRSPTRPSSYAMSESDSGSGGEPSDEMMRLLVDLKAERDELKRDVDGWRTRVADLEKQVGVFAGRIESERREAWVARSQAGLLLSEKKVLTKQIEDSATVERDLRSQLASMKEKVDQGRVAEEECKRLRAQLAEKEEDTAELFATPTPHRNSGSGLIPEDEDEVYNESSSFNFGVEPSPFNFGVKPPSLAASEGHDDHDEEEEDEDELAGYEDEDEELDCQSPGSSVGSLDDFQSRQAISSFRFGDTAPLPPSLSVSVSPSPFSSPCPSPAPALPTTHAKNASLSRAWTFPSVKHSAPVVIREPEAVDRFFGCLEDLDASPPMNERHNPFAAGFGLDDDGDLPPFLLPCNVGTVDAVVEEEVDEEPQVEAVDGGLRVTSSAPEPAPEAKPRPSFGFEEEEEQQAPFAFRQPSTQLSTPKIKRDPSPSSIPRPVLRPRTPLVSTPPRSHANPAHASPITPPNKRSGASSFIPQPTSTTPTRASPAVSVRQPSRIPPAPQTTNADAQSPSAFSSMIGSPLAFRLFNNMMMPSLWGEEKEVASVPVVRERRFVEREAQLAKLKAKMEESLVLTSRLDVCSACDPRLVLL